MNLVKNKLKEGLPVYGVLSPSFDPVIVEMLGALGLDYFMIEGEHASPDDASSIQYVCRAAELSGMTPLARVRSNDPKLILQYLEAGIKGIMLPGVKNAEEVGSFIKSLKYPPNGIRGLGPSRANDYLLGQKSIDQIIEESNEEIMSIVQVETKEAYENLDEILSVPGIDLIVIGTADLSLSMGLKDSDSGLQQVVKTIQEAAHQLKIPVGMVASKKTDFKRLEREGVAFYITPLGHLIKRGLNKLKTN